MNAMCTHLSGLIQAFERVGMKQVGEKEFYCLAKQSSATSKLAGMLVSHNFEVGTVEKYSISHSVKLKLNYFRIVKKLLGEASIYKGKLINVSLSSQQSCRC